MAGSLLKCMAYGVVLMAGIVFDVLQYIFQTLVMTAGKPKLGFAFTVAAGVTNIVLDWLLIYVLGWGVGGAAWATVIGCAVGGMGPLVYFARPNSSALRLGRARLDRRALGKAAANGSSEMVTNIAMSLVSIVYNMQLLHLIGENGVAAYGVIMYVSFVFEIGAVMLLPTLLGADGIWWSASVAEVAAAAITALLVAWLTPKYGL